MINSRNAKNVVTLDGRAICDVEYDVLALTFTEQVTGEDSHLVQEVLTDTLRAALKLITPYKKKDEVEVETTGLHITPQYADSTKDDLLGYTGTVSLIVKGTDTSTISKIGGSITSMPIASVAQSVSRKLRASKETELIAEAAANFKLKAEQISHLFGFDSYKIESISITVDDQCDTYNSELLSTGVSKSYLEAVIYGSIILDNIGI